MNKVQADNLRAARDEILQRAAQFDMNRIVAYRVDGYNPGNVFAGATEDAPAVISSAEDPKVCFCIAGLLFINHDTVERCEGTVAYYSPTDLYLGQRIAEIIGTNQDHTIALINFDEWPRINASFANLSNTAEDAAIVINEVLSLYGYAPKDKVTQ